MPISGLALHSVGNHTVGHPSLAEIGEEQVIEELAGLERNFNEKFRKKMLFMRPPKGEYNENVLKIARKMKYCTLFWSFAYDDWDVKKIRGKEYPIQKVTENLHNGAVLLLHAVSKDNAEGLEGIISNARSKGYEFGNPEELCRGIQ